MQHLVMLIIVHGDGVAYLPTPPQSVTVRPDAARHQLSAGGCQEISAVVREIKINCVQSLQIFVTKFFFMNMFYRVCSIPENHVGKSYSNS